MIFPSLTLRNRAANSASAAEATTNFRMPEKTKMDPFNCIGCPFLSVDPRKNMPATRLNALDSDKYEASEWEGHYEEQWW